MITALPGPAMLPKFHVMVVSPFAGCCEVGAGTDDENWSVCGPTKVIFTFVALCVTVLLTEMVDFSGLPLFT